jgi:hypothetical protein
MKGKYVRNTKEPAIAGTFVRLPKAVTLEPPKVLFPAGRGHNVLTIDKAPRNVQDVCLVTSCWQFPPSPLQEVLHL